MAFPPGFLDELRSRLSLAALVGRRVRLVRRGREYAGLCPFHNEKTPSFYVVEDKAFFHCFGCGAHGDAIGFVMRADNLDFLEAVEKLAAEAGLAVPKSTPEERERAQRQKTLQEALEAAAAFYEGRLWGSAGAAARDYLKGRGLDEATIRHFRLGWASADRHALKRALSAEFPLPLLVEAGLLRQPEEGEAYDWFRERVMFPILDRGGRVIAFGGRVIGAGEPKYLNSPETPIFEKGRVLYGWAQARAALRLGGGESLVVTEGYMDVIALYRAGFKAAVAPLGTALTEAHLAELWRLAPEPVLCFDGDAAGERAAVRALRRALPLLRPGQSLLFASLPAGEDPDSLIRGQGRAAFEEVLRTAQPLSRKLWELAVAARPLDTPERRADLERRLEDEIRLIADRAVQAEYRRFVRERLYEASRASRPPFRPAREPRRRHVSNGPPRPPSVPGKTQREVLLGTLVEHPFLILDLCEEIAALDFVEPELSRLRDGILAIPDLENSIDAGDLRSRLMEVGLGNMVEALLARPMVRTALRRSAREQPELIRLRVEAALQLLRRQDRGELAEAENAFSVAPTEENSNRLTRLKEQEHQRHEVESDDRDEHL
ncbi:MAG TPA: DNA primase [Stellaceae bacterium]|nr:DNA primase [Stellaceae bacterium]